MMSEAAAPSVSGPRAGEHDHLVFRHARIPSITVRALCPGDEESILSVFDGMSAKSRRLRYLAATPRLTAGALRQLAAVDHRTRGAWVARDGEQVIGIARYARVVVDGAEESAEIALEVVDAHHGRGVGRLLIEVLATVLDSLAVRRWHWSGHPANDGMRALARPLRATWRFDGGQLVGQAWTHTSPAKSGVTGVLVAGVTDRLELERAVLHVEVPGQALLQLVQQFGQVAVAEAGVVDHHVGGEHRQIAGH
jgi:GNAT superfamily N-acetyltransferase